MVAGWHPLYRSRFSNGTSLFSRFPYKFGTAETRYSSGLYKSKNWEVIVTWNHHVFAILLSRGKTDCSLVETMREFHS